MANLPVTFIVLGAGALFVRSGIANTPGGVVGELGRLLRGEPAPVKPATDAGGVLSLAPAFLSATTAAPSTPAGGSSGGAGAAVVAEATRQLGKPYVWGGNGPSSFDCSGLTVWCYAHGAGVTLPRVAAAQQTKGQAIPEAQAAPGDLVFWGMPATHVGIYVGAGRMIHAPHPGAVVRYEAVTPAVTSGPMSFRRILGAAPAGGSVAFA